ncbi:MAG: hypothetical protein JWM43_2279 [Acidobacteriaceae bacterium]|nr:hypothetical protein [Acidobacteriaceae bacterium]
MANPNQSGTRRSQRESLIFIPLACLAALAVAAVSFLPSEDKQTLHTRGHYHSWGHLLAFTVIGYITSRTSRSTPVRIVLFLGCIAFGFGIEYAEAVAFHGAMEWKDILVDTLGVVCGTFAATVTAPPSKSR